MSSFIGHGLAALTIGKALEPAGAHRVRPAWYLWLLLAALLPDIDYLIHQLNSVNNQGVRITHSAGFSILLTIFGLFHLFLFDPKHIARGALQCLLAGFSHLFLDTLVGSRLGDPWLYPLASETYRLPFGILPASARIGLSNYYMYRNLLIELGIMLPACLLILRAAGKIVFGRAATFLLLGVLAVFLSWSIGLAR